jgi:hypothetical protein
MFNLGMDTKTIAQVLDVEESNVYNILAFAKSVEKNFGSDSQIVRTSTKREQHLAHGRGPDVSQYEIPELETFHIQGNYGSDDGPKGN